MSKLGSFIIEHIFQASKLRCLLQMHGLQARLEHKVRSYLLTSWQVSLPLHLIEYFIALRLLLEEIIWVM